MLFKINCVVVVNQINANILLAMNTMCCKNAKYFTHSALTRGVDHCNINSKKTTVIMIIKKMYVMKVILHINN